MCIQTRPLLLSPQSYSPLSLSCFFASSAKNNYVFTGCLHHFFPGAAASQPLPQAPPAITDVSAPPQYFSAAKSLQRCWESKCAPSTSPFCCWNWPRNFIFPTKIPFRKIFDQEFKSTLKRNILLSLDLLLSWRRGDCKWKTSVPFIEHLGHEGNRQWEKGFLFVSRERKWRRRRMETSEQR